MPKRRRLNIDALPFIKVGAALTAAAEDETQDEGDASERRRWGGPMAFEGIETDDARLIEPDALSWRELPLSLMVQWETPDFGGHAGAVLVGQIDQIERQGGDIYAEGSIRDDEDGQKAVDAIEAGDLTGISIDLAVHEAEL